MYLLSPPWIYRKLLSKAMFRMPDDKIYLTFDDGPEPTVTPKVLETLRQENILSTFFMLGSNAEKHPELVERIREDGHTVGNHGYGHLDAWKHTPSDILVDAEKCEAITGSKLYRPPYGRLWPSHLNTLIENGFKVVNWTILSADFDRSINSERVVKNVLGHVKPGCIIVMHDSIQAKSNLLGSLPLIIQELKAKGHTFGKL